MINKQVIKINTNIKQILTNINMLIFKFVWKSRLDDEYKLIRIVGWRTCIIETKFYQRRRITFLFKWEHVNNYG